MNSGTQFEDKYNIIDTETPKNSLMRGRYKRSFAYYTLRERLPVILTQIVDNLSRDKEAIIEQNGEGTSDDLKQVLGNLSKLKYQLQTDKPLEPFTGTEADRDAWNKFISELPADENSFFKTCWLYAECYMYRSVKTFFEATETIKEHDYFRKQKENALTNCTEALENVVTNTRDSPLSGEFFIRLLKLNLWGNRFDLSISEGKEIKQSGPLFESIDSLDANILVDDTVEIWNCISQPVEGASRQVDLVQDNSGFECFTDFIVAEYLIEKNLASKVRFHVKAIPWFISDVTPNDFHWTLNYLKSHPTSQILRKVGDKWSHYLEVNKFELAPVDWFWTSPYEFYRMKEVNKQLYDSLAQSHLIIFKGDLNYRKLIGDFRWEFTEEFRTCLRGFHPSNICSLRTVKADLICGLKEGMADNLNQTHPDWMTTGNFGVLQFCSDVV